MTALLLCYVLMAQVGAGELGEAYLAHIARADSLYHGHRYEQALPAYEAAHRLLPDEPGPLVGIGWTYLKMGEFAAAESAFRAALDANPGNRTAKEGLVLLPNSYRFKATLVALGGFDSTRSIGGFFEYNHHHRTTVTLGLQSISRTRGWQGFNTALVVYHRLAYPWSVRLDFLTLSAFNDPRYWQMVYAPSVTRQFGDMPVRLAVVAWDNLDVVGIQADAAQQVGSRLRIGLTPALNLAQGKPGWFVPVEVGWQAFSWLRTRATFGFGSIASHVDLAIPTLYNQKERLSATVRAGLDVTILQSYRLSLFAAMEKYTHQPPRIFPSLALSARF